MNWLRVVSLLFFLAMSPSIFASTVDSLAALLEQEGKTISSEERYALQFQLGEAHFAGDNENYQIAGEYYEKAYQLAQAHEWLDRQLTCLLKMGKCAQRLNDFQAALEYYFKVVEIVETGTESPILAQTYSQMATIYRALGEYEKAYTNQLQTLLFYENTNDSLGIAHSHYNLGGIFFYQEHYENALKHYLQANAIVEAAKNERLIYSTLAALGSVYDKLGEQGKSLSNNMRSLQLARKQNYKTGIAYALGNIAMNYLGSRDFEQAEKFLTESATIKLELGDRWGVIGANIDRAKLYLEWKRPARAVEVLKPALALSQELDSKSRQPEILQLLAQAHIELDKPREAYYFSNQYIVLKDSLLNEKMVEEMGQSHRKYEVAKKENEIALLKKENELLGKNKKIQNQQIYIFAIAAVAFVLFLLWYRNKLKYQNRVNRLLEEKNQMLNVKNEEIHIKNKQLEYSNEDLQQFAYVASHDLKEPLRMIGSYSKLLERRYKSQLDENGQEFLFYIVDAVQRMGTLLDDLLDFSRAGTQEAPNRMVSTDDVMVLVSANLRHHLEDFNARLIIHHDRLPLVKAHSTQLLQLLQNLVSNGIKFKGEEDPVVEVDCQKTAQHYCISIKDNGIGISQKNLKKVFEMFRRLHTRDEYEGTGIGLATCKRIVSKWGGDIWVESEEGKGSTFFFTIPLCIAADPPAKVAVHV